MIVNQQDFNPLIGEVYHTCLLPREQVETINALVATRDMHVVGIQWCSKIKVVKFLMGNFATISIPAEYFFEDENGVTPQFEYPWIDDWGFDLYLGNYKIDIRAALLLK